MNNKIAWEKWDEADFITEALSGDEELEEMLESPDLPPMNLGSFSVTFPKIRTPLGFFSIDDPLRPASMFDCWIGHTNFGLTMVTINLIYWKLLRLSLNLTNVGQFSIQKRVF